MAGQLHDNNVDSLLLSTDVSTNTCRLTPEPSRRTTYSAALTCHLYPAAAHKSLPAGIKYPCPRRMRPVSGPQSVGRCPVGILKSFSDHLSSPSFVFTHSPPGITNAGFPVGSRPGKWGRSLSPSAGRAEASNSREYGLAPFLAIFNLVVQYGVLRKVFLEPSRTPPRWPAQLQPRGAPCNKRSRVAVALRKVECPPL